MIDGFEPTFPERFNLADYYLDARVREGKGDRRALIHGDRTYTFAECQAMANRMAHLLVASGVTIEDRVLIALPDCPEFMAAFFATLKLGAVVTMVNPRLPPEDYAYYLEYTRARALICDESLFQAVQPRSPHLRAVLRRGGGLEAQVAAYNPTFDNADTHRDDIAIWLFTSGSTGKPKAAVHMHHDFAFNTEAYAKRVLGLREDDLTLSVPKLFFGYATGTNLMFPFAVGAATVLYEEAPSPAVLFDLIEKHRPTILTNVPTMIGKMLASAESGETGRRDLSSLRFSLSAGEALPEDLYRRWVERYRSEILDGIGSAELFHIYITNYPGDVKPGSLGKLVPGYQARLVDDDGNDVPDGQIGTLWVKGDSAALCYFQAHEKSKEVLRGDWVVSGDKFRRDEQGYWYYHGRGDDLLKVGGIFVAPVEVENVLMQHPAIHECVVVGYKDDEGLVKAKAVVVPARGHDPSDGLAAELVEFARARLAHYKAPRRVEFRDALPRNDRGKISRKEVR